MGRASVRTKWLITVAAPCAALLLLELGLRAVGFEHELAAVPVVVWSDDQDGGLDERTALHQRDRSSLWAPRPGAMVDHASGERIDALGFRGPAPAASRDPSVLRVVLLGESSTFGMNLPWDQTCAPQLAQRLAERGIRAEVVNAGVIGHTVCQGLGRYRSAVRGLHPDVVVIAYGAQNEHAPAQGPGDREKLELASDEREGWRTTWLVLSRHLRVLQLCNWMLCRRAAPELKAWQDDQARQRSQDPAQIGQPDWSGDRRVPLDAFEGTLRELCAEVRADGARPLLCSLPRTPETEARLPILPLYSAVIERLGRELDLPVVDLRAAVLASAAAGQDASSFFIPTDTWHVGARGQTLLAALLADTLAPPAPR